MKYPEDCRTLNTEQYGIHSFSNTPGFCPSMDETFNQFIFFPTSLDVLKERFLLVSFTYLGA